MDSSGSPLSEEGRLLSINHGVEKKKKSISNGTQFSQIRSTRRHRAATAVLLAAHTSYIFISVFNISPLNAER